jgi:ribosomal protein S18 acetylase RimI-like enzyme
MWRMAAPSDDEAIVRMCLALNAEDPGPEPVPPQNMQRTLRVLRETPLRGRAVVLERDGQACGYALLISFWSNELGGDVDVIDEIYVDPAHRGRRYATSLIETLANGTAPTASSVVALALEVSPDNLRARRLYERLGFQARNLAMRRLLPRALLPALEK